MSLVEKIHDGYVLNRRVRVLTEHLARLLPQGARVLDVGCGDGLIARLIMDRRPDLEIRGVDVLVRDDTAIPVEAFDGQALPSEDDSYDAVLFVDVLHHTDDPMILLREAARVARRTVLMKDHTADGFLARPTLRFMDRVGNARHGVRLPYNYWAKARWLDAFAQLGLTVEDWEQDLGLYPAPASWLFGRSLHVIARLATPAEDGPRPPQGSG